MDLDRRTALRLAGIGAVSTLAGCLGGGGEDGTGDGTPTATPGGSGSTVTGHESLAFAVRGSAPEWYRDGDGPVGDAVVIDTRSRQRAALDGYDHSGEREAEVEAFLQGVDYSTERLLLLESVGPDTCHDRLEVGDVRMEDGTLRVAATVVDTSGTDEACGDAITFPSTLLAVTFDGGPVDGVAVEFTDGWDETGTVTASTDDPLPAPDPEDLPGHVRPDSEPQPLAPLACEEEGVHRHPQSFEEADLQWGDFEGGDGYYGDHDGPVLSLRVDAPAFEYGDTATVTLTDVAGESVETGNRMKYNLQVYTDDGWQDVRVKDESGHWAYTDDAHEHEPGEGFEWSVELTEEGIIASTYHDDARVCPDLQSGRYRFAYFGVIGDGAVSASFDLDV